MSEPMAVSFDLTPETISDLLNVRTTQIRGYIYAGAMLVAGIVCIATSSLAAVGIILIALAIVLTFFLTQMPKHRQTQSARLAGTTEVEFSEKGIVYSGVTVAENLEWSRVGTLADRPKAWVILTRPSSGIYLVPKSAIPAEQAAQFTSALKTWSGSAYKQRRR